MARPSMFASTSFSPAATFPVAMPSTHTHAYISGEKAPADSTDRRTAVATVASMQDPLPVSQKSVRTCQK
jgi:hypothetical protein